MRPAIGDELLVRVLRAYPIEGLRAVELMEASKRNDNFLVEDGAGRRYVLRYYRRNPDEHRMRFQLRFQQQLLRLGYPTSEIIEPIAGGLFLVEDSGPWVLFTFVDGQEYDFSRMGQVAEAGRRLAPFHTVTLSTELEEVVLDINVKARSWWTHGEEELAALEALYRDAGVEGEMAFLRSWHADMLRDWPLDRLEALPAGWVHSDFHGRNMVFVDDELRGLFDFDPLHRGFWVEDIGHALFMFAREFRGSMRIRPDAARIFIDAYSATRPLPQEESEAIPMMAVLAWVPSAPYQKLHHRDGEDSLAWFRHYIVLMREIEAEMSRLAPLLSC